MKPSKSSRKQDDSPKKKSPTLKPQTADGVAFWEEEGVKLHPRTAALLRTPLPEHIPQHRLDAIRAASDALRYPPPPPWEEEWERRRQKKD